MGIFSQEDKISKEYLKQKGFKPFVNMDTWEMYFKLIIYTDTAFIKYRHTFHYIPFKNICEFDTVRSQEYGRKLKQTFTFEDPQTQIDMDIIIERCRQIVSTINNVDLDRVKIEL